MATTKKLWCGNCEDYLEYWGREETIAACPGCTLVARQP